MCSAAPKGPVTAAPEVVAPDLTLLDEDSPGDKRNKQARGRGQVTNTGLQIPGTTTGGSSAPSTGLSIPSPSKK